jgi:hypothetical protein
MTLIHAKLDRCAYAALMGRVEASGTSINDVLKSILKQHHASNHHLPAVGHDLDDQQPG